MRSKAVDPFKHLRHYSLTGFFVLMASVLALVACAPILVSPYDERIDTGVTEFSEAVARFTAEMNRKARTREGTHAANREFYEAWDAKLAALTERAIARDPGGVCPGTETFGGIVSRGFGEFAQLVNREGAQAEIVLQGDCTAQLLKLLEVQFDDLEKFHQAQREIGIPEQARAPVDLLRTNIRSVLYTEIAKKAE